MLSMMSGPSLRSRAASFKDLLTRDILPLLLDHLSEQEKLLLRQLSSEVQEAHDAQEQCLVLRNDRTNAAPLPDLLKSAQRKLAHGCRPGTVTLRLVGASTDEFKQAAASLLSACLSSPPVVPLPTAALHLNALLLDPILARAAAAAFPNLTHLEVTDLNQVAATDASAAAVQEALVVLLGTGSAIASGDGGATSTSALMLLPALTCVKLQGATRLDPALAAALARRTSLRELHLTFDYSHELSVTDAAALRSLTTLTQLSVLALDISVTAPDLASLLAALTGLTYLQAGRDQEAYSPAMFAHLTRLRHLKLGCNLEVVGLDTALCALTTLEVDALVLPPDAAAPPVAAAGRARQPAYAMPKRLQRLLLSHWKGLNVGVLAALCPPASLREFEPRIEVSLELMPHRHVDTENGELLQSGEEELCGALRFLAGRVESVCLDVCSGRSLQPWRGAGGGGQQPTHRRWLEAMGGVGLKRVDLNRIALGFQDFRAIAEHFTSVEELLFTNSTFPLHGLLLLARMPKLHKLYLDVDHLIEDGDGPAGEGAHVPTQRETCLALFALCVAAAAASSPLMRVVVQMNEHEAWMMTGDELGPRARAAEGLADKAHTMLQEAGLRRRMVDWEYME